MIYISIQYDFYQNNQEHWFLGKTHISDQPITSLDLPPSVINASEIQANSYAIHAYAFTSCVGVTEITIPNSVTELSNNWLEGSDIVVLNFQHTKRLPKLSGNPFHSDRNRLVTIKYPNGKSDMYEYWAKIWGKNSNMGYNLQFQETQQLITAQSVFPPLVDAAERNRATIIYEVEPQEFGIMPYVGTYGYQDDSAISPTFDFPEATTLNKYSTDDTQKFLIENNGPNKTRILKADIYLDEQDITYNVDIIGTNSFYNSNIATLKTSATKLEPLAFQNCNQLTEINFTGAKPTIARNAFLNCPKLAYISWNNNNNKQSFWTENNTLVWVAKSITTIDTTIDDYLFGTSNGGDGTNEIQPYILQNSKIIALTIPASVTRIGRHAFQNCTELQELAFEPRAAEGQSLIIEDYAFDGCTKLSMDITLIESFAQIGYRAFGIGSDEEGDE